MTHKLMVRGYNPPAGPTMGRNKRRMLVTSNDTLTSGSLTLYDRVNDGHPASYDVAYGKDASGNGIYVMSQGSSTKVSVSSTDVTDGYVLTLRTVVLVTST